MPKKIIYKKGDILGNATFIKNMVEGVPFKIGISAWALLKCNLCGNIFIGHKSKIKNKENKSCGCLLTRKWSVTHGKSRTKEYETWLRIIERCYNPKSSSYKIYGAVGVTVCEKWKNSFEEFFKDMGECPKNKNSIDRYPISNGNYEPNNCRWADYYEQSNNRICNIVLEKNGVKKTLKQWADFFNIKYVTAQSRHRKGLPFDYIFSKNRVNKKTRKLWEQHRGAQ